MAGVGLLAMGLNATSAFAVPIPNVNYTGAPTVAGTYDPLQTNNNVLSHDICSTGNPCSNLSPATTATDVWYINVVNSGILTLTATKTTLPPLDQFDVFAARLYDKNNFLVASAFPLSPNPIAISVAGSQYRLELDWSLTSLITGGADTSALYSLNVTTAPGSVPEPGSLALLALGVLGLGLSRRRAH
jgi:hypothetical protein